MFVQLPQMLLITAAIGMMGTVLSSPLPATAQPKNAQLQTVPDAGTPAMNTRAHKALREQAAKNSVTDNLKDLTVLPNGEVELKSSRAKAGSQPTIDTPSMNTRSRTKAQQEAADVPITNSLADLKFIRDKKGVAVRVELTNAAKKRLGVTNK